MHGGPSSFRTVSNARQEGIIKKGKEPAIFLPDPYTNVAVVYSSSINQIAETVLLSIAPLSYLLTFPSCEVS